MQLSGGESDEELSHGEHSLLCLLFPQCLLLFPQCLVIPPLTTPHSTCRQIKKTADETFSQDQSDSEQTQQTSQVRLEQQTYISQYETVSETKQTTDATTEIAVSPKHMIHHNT